jgi:glycerol-3-phosphate dehydrogenase
LVRRYGTNIAHIYDLLPAVTAKAEQCGLPPAVYASLVYAMDQEMALKPDDFLIRRTGALFFNIAQAHIWKKGVMQAMVEHLHYSAEQVGLYEQELERQLREAVTPADRSETVEPA